MHAQYSQEGQNSVFKGVARELLEDGCHGRRALRGGATGRVGSQCRKQVGNVVFVRGGRCYDRRWNLHCWASRAKSSSRLSTEYALEGGRNRWLRLLLDLRRPCRLTKHLQLLKLLKEDRIDTIPRTHCRNLGRVGQALARVAKRRVAFVGTLQVRRREEVSNVVEGDVLVLVDPERREANMTRLQQRSSRSHRANRRSEGVQARCVLSERMLEMVMSSEPN